MSLILCELFSGSRIDLCTFANGASGAFDAFLDGIGEDREARLLSLLEHLSLNGSIENPEIFSAVPGRIGLFKIAVAGTELACFRQGRKLVICKHTDGKLSRLSLEEAHFTQTQYLVNGQNPEPKGSKL
jgi:hypothetical protein